MVYFKKEYYLYIIIYLPFYITYLFIYLSFYICLPFYILWQGLFTGMASST
jgi:hypothetical protein